MSDFAITRTVTENRVDTRWRASRHGQFTAQPGTLDLTAFEDGVHYNIGGRTDNVIPSGVLVTLDTDSGQYVPWAAGEDEDPDPTIDGIINDNQGIDVLRADGTESETAPFARLLHGFVEVAYLPVASQRAAFGTADSTVQITTI